MVGKGRKNGVADLASRFLHRSIKRECMAEPWDVCGQLYLGTFFLIVAASFILQYDELSDRTTTT